MDQLKGYASKLAQGIRYAIGGPALAIELPPLYPLQEQIKREARRFNVLDIGRRAGKTYLGEHLAIETAAAGQPTGWFCPSYKYLLETWDDLTRALRPYATKVNATERRIELSNGGLVECWTLDGSDDPGRSRKYKRAIVDEAAIAANLKAVWEQAIRPTLTDLEGDAWFLSTPKGLNYFHELFKRGQDPLAYPDWQSWQMPSSVNPFLPPKEIEAARLGLPELAYKQEYLAEFLSSEGAVFRNVEACLTALPTTPAEHRTHLIVGGVDWGRSHDFTALSLFCCNCACEVFLDRFNQVGWQLQRDRLLAALERWNAKYVRIEMNSVGSPNLEALRDAAPERVSLAGFETTAKSKGPLIQRLVLAFENQSARWLPDPVGKHELLAYEATITESGYAKYSAPEGQHDDTVICRALCWKEAEAYMPVGLTEEEQTEAALPPGLRRAHLDTVPPSYDRDFGEMMRDFRLKRHEREQRIEGTNWSSEIIDPNDDPWAKDAYKDTDW
jgi:hypothetical protein